MICWNVASKMIECRFEGRVFDFSPNERKKIHDPDVYNHLFYKLKKYGLVLLNEDNLTPDIEKKALIDGLKSRWKTYDFVVRNYRTMNKDRESNKLAAESPSESVMLAAEEAAELLDRLKGLEGERLKKVESYLNDDRAKKAAEDIDSSQQVIQTKGSFETVIGAKRPGRPRKDASLTVN